MTDPSAQAPVPATCELCGEPMPQGEEMFKFHGYSGPCPKPPLEKPEIPCNGDTHRWPENFTDGDTCNCGALYLFTREDGGPKVVNS